MYFQSVVIPVRVENRQVFVDMAGKMSSLFAEHGATRSVECWGDDLSDGKVTDFKQAVQAREDETVVFSWDWWPDKAAYDAAMIAIRSDESGTSGGEMPFDRQRLIFGTFEACFDTGGSHRFGYLDAMVGSVPDANRRNFIDHGEKMAGLFQEHGALRVANGWGVDTPTGKVTDFRRAVQAKAGEAVVVGWIEWPDKPTRDRGMGALMRDQRMSAAPPVWNGPLAIFGGFSPVHDTAAE